MGNAVGKDINKYIRFIPHIIAIVINLSSLCILPMKSDCGGINSPVMCPTGCMLCTECETLGHLWQPVRVYYCSCWRTRLIQSSAMSRNWSWTRLRTVAFSPIFPTQSDSLFNPLWLVLQSFFFYRVCVMVANMSTSSIEVQSFKHVFISWVM